LEKICRWPWLPASFQSVYFWRPFWTEISLTCLGIKCRLIEG
jgi:hypothetical protein